MEYHERRLLRYVIIIVVVIIGVIIELIRMWRRRKVRDEAAALGPEEYLKYLKTEYHELKFRYDTASSYKEHEKWHREMKDIEQKIIQTEQDIENRN